MPRAMREDASATRLSDPESLKDVAFAAAFLGTSTRHIRRLVAERRLAFVRVGGKVRFTGRDLRAFVNNSRVEAER